MTHYSINCPASFGHGRDAGHFFVCGRVGDVDVGLADAARRQRVSRIGGLRVGDGADDVAGGIDAERHRAAGQERADVEQNKA